MRPSAPSKKPRPLDLPPPRPAQKSWGNIELDAVEELDELKPGRVIDDKYELVDILGTGAMGTVWLAKNRRLEVNVALKVLHTQLVSDRSARRLLQEARTAAKLEHPSIVKVFDFGESKEGYLYIVMEVLRGELLMELIRRKRRLSPAVAVRTLLPVVAAVAAAHEKGVVHRDLKPDNILLATDDSGSVVPKVLDFGIAKLKRQTDGRRRLTQDRSLVGTPHYMAPEQLSWKEEIDARADVWAIAVVLYESISGEVPFDGDDTHAIFRAIGEEQPQTLEQLNVADATLSAIVQRGLAKDKNLRWSSMRELGLGLAGWALDNQIDSDIAGASIVERWFAGGRPRPFSDFPPAMPGPGSERETMPAPEEPAELAPPELAEPESRAPEAPGESSRSRLIYWAAGIGIGAAAAGAIVVAAPTAVSPRNSVTKTESTHAPALRSPPPAPTPVVAEPARSATLEPPPPEVTPSATAPASTPTPTPRPLVAKPAPAPTRAISPAPAKPASTAARPLPSTKKKSGAIIPSKPDF